MKNLLLKLSYATSSARGCFTMLILTFLFGAGAVIAKSSESASLPRLDESSIVTTIAFGSCAKERLPQPVWETILQHSPDVFLFIGDNQYADIWQKDESIDKLTMEPVTKAGRFDEAYAELAAIPEFAAFRKQVPILATWDDHDYGANDQGKEYVLKAESQRAFINFYDFPSRHPIYEQEGIYHSTLAGPKGKRVQFILLDTRYHRDALYPNPKGRQNGKGPYLPHPKGDPSVLGERQWQWLEKELLKPADIRIIASSIQLVAYEHGWESWGNFPKERQRFYDLINKTQAKGVLVVSGDRHLTEISVDKGQKGAKVPYPIWDFTSSGINQTESPVEDENTFRQGNVARKTNYGIFEIEWDTSSQKTKIHLKSFDDQKKIITQQTVWLSTLQ